MNSLPVLEPLVRDLRYAFRMLRKTPGFTLVALVTLAVGIGVNTAVFTVVNALLLKPLPFPEPARLATVSTLTRTPKGGGENTVGRRQDVPGDPRQRGHGRRRGVVGRHGRRRQPGGP